MKEQILETLRKHSNGLRKREISFYANIWVGYLYQGGILSCSMWDALSRISIILQVQQFVNRQVAQIYMQQFSRNYRRGRRRSSPLIITYFCADVKRKNS